MRQPSLRESLSSFPGYACGQHARHGDQATRKKSQADGAINMKLFYDDEFDALQQMIAASNRTFKDCATFLWPDLKPESAYARLKACVNAHGDQNLKFGQIISLARYCGRFDALYYMADELAHARPGPINPRDELA